MCHSLGTGNSEFYLLPTIEQRSQLNNNMEESSFREGGEEWAVYARDCCKQGSVILYPLRLHNLVVDVMKHVSFRSI